MSIKYFCDRCDKELKFDGCAEESESGYDWGYATHFHDIGIVHEDRENEDMNDRYRHTCRECDLKENGEESWYFEEPVQELTLEELEARVCTCGELIEKCEDAYEHITKGE